MIVNELRFGLRRAAVWLAVALAMCLASYTGTSAQNPKTVPRAAQIDEFHKSIAEYVTLHKKEAATLPALKPTENPEKISAYQHALAKEIRDARPHAKQGDVFTPPVAMEFRRLIALSMRGQQATRIKSSLKSSPKVTADIAVNGPYPASGPLETMPSSLLQNLPELPPELEYRVVAHNLILRDVTANLIVDYLPNGIPW